MPVAAPRAFGITLWLLEALERIFVTIADGSLQQIALQASSRSSGLVTHFLEK